MGFHRGEEMTGRFVTIAAFLALGLLVTPSADASSLTMNAAEYEEALTFITETKEAMKEAEAALAAPTTTREEAAARKTDLGTRLHQLRRLMTHAAQRDRIGARGMVTPERERARKVIAKAGALEDRLQDLWTAWAQRTRSNPQ